MFLSMPFNDHNCFRLTIRNVNYNYYNTLKALEEGFRLTIRNVNKVLNWVPFAFTLGFRLTIRNVNINLAICSYF